MPVPYERVLALLFYDPATGFFTWRAKSSPLSRAHIGARAGALKSGGYFQIKIDGYPYNAHRLAWLYMTGEWPSEKIDHINCNPSDNRFRNLREATNAQNTMNSRPMLNTSCRLKGVHWWKRNQAYYAQIKHNGVRYHLGAFNCPAAAHFAYVIAAHELFGEFARTA